jgi:peptide/nickel transport system permease protein
MLVYTIRRLLTAIPTLIGISLITFLLVRVSGDPARFVLGDTATEEAIAQFRAQHGLDQPLPVQYLSYMAGVVRGDLGTSLRYQEPVWDLFSERILATLELGLAAYAVAIVFGVTIGVYAAVRAGSVGDQIARFFVLFGQAIPGFYLGLVLIILVSVGLGWLPTGGRGGLSHLILPTISLGSFLTALIVRFSRSMMLDVLNQEYIRTARAKGLRDTTVIFRHALRNALIPLITVLALQSSVVFSGAVVTETVFSWPGIGRFAVQAISTRDYPVVQGTVLILTTIVVLLNLVVDLAYAFLDPRISYS